MPCAFNAFYGCLRTSSFQCRLLRRKNSIEAATKLKKRNVTNFCCSIIVPQGKFLSFLTLNLSLFLFFFRSVLWARGRGEVENIKKGRRVVVFFIHREHGGCLWLCEAQAKKYPLYFLFSTYIFNPLETDLLAFYKGSSFHIQKSIDDVCVLFFFCLKKSESLNWCIIFEDINEGGRDREGEKLSQSRRDRYSLWCRWGGKSNTMRMFSDTFSPVNTCGWCCLTFFLKLNKCRIFSLCSAPSPLKSLGAVKSQFM